MRASNHIGGGIRPLRYAVKMTHPSEFEFRPVTILIDVQLHKTPAEEHGASLQELRRLIETLGWDIVGTLAQKLQSPTAASLIGPGKLEGLSELVKRPHKAASVVFDHELTLHKSKH
jgi:50S ribosomal subunit-associated GTPase HflX